MSAGSSGSALQSIPILRLHSQTISESVLPRQVHRSPLTQQVLEETGSPFQPRGAAAFQLRPPRAGSLSPAQSTCELHQPRARHRGHQVAALVSWPVRQKPPAGSRGPGEGAPAPNHSCSRKRGTAWERQGQWGERGVGGTEQRQLKCHQVRPCDTPGAPVHQARIPNPRGHTDTDTRTRAHTIMCSQPSDDLAPHCPESLL